MGKTSNEDFVKFFAILGGIIALIEALFALSGRALQRFYNLGPMAAVIAIILSILVLLSAIKPNNPIPFNWILFTVSGIVLIICGSIVGGIIVLLAGIIFLVIENK